MRKRNPLFPCLLFLTFDREKKFTRDSSLLSIFFHVSPTNSPFDQRNLDRRGRHRDTRAFSSTLDRRPRRGSFSLFSHPARGYDALRILEGRGRTRSGSATEKRTRREGTEVRSQSREPDRPRHRRRISTELEFKLARPVGDVTQYFRFRRTRIAANDVNAPSSSSSPLVVARNVALSFSSCFSGQGQVARAVHCN